MSTMMYAMLQAYKELLDLICYHSQVSCTWIKDQITAQRSLQALSFGGRTYVLGGGEKDWVVNVSEADCTPRTCKPTPC
jgi:hypothetical protein